MDLERIEARKKIFKSSGFRNSKTLNSYNIVIPIMSKPFTGRIVNYPVDEEVFWKKSSGQRLWQYAKNQFEKKNRGSSRFEGSGLQLGVIPIFLTPEKSHFMSVILDLCLFPVINP